MRPPRFCDRFGFAHRRCPFQIAAFDTEELTENFHACPANTPALARRIVRRAIILSRPSAVRSRLRVLAVGPESPPSPSSPAPWIMKHLVDRRQIKTESLHGAVRWTSERI